MVSISKSIEVNQICLRFQLQSSLTKLLRLSKASFGLCLRPSLESSSTALEASVLSYSVFLQSDTVCVKKRTVLMISLY
ncbi:hypothetical protein evm_004024 [Chilo suppressalis]|nr:hypothetical protein evm_004024 [Chilo suppressalis]